MNILIISKHYYPAVSARALQVKKLVDALLSVNDCMVHVITLSINQNVKIQACLNKEKTYYVGKGDVDSNIAHRVKDKVKRELNIVSEWVKYAVDEAVNIIGNNKIDIMLSISTPIDSHYVALKVKNKIFGLPWIAYFSDPWPLLPYPYQGFVNSVFKKFFIPELKKMIFLSDAVVVPNEHQKKYMTGMINADENVQKKFLVVPHIGDNISMSVVPNKRNKFLVYAGEITKERVNKNLIKAVKDLHLTYSDLFDGLAIYGDVCNKFNKYVKKYDAGHSIIVNGRVGKDKLSSVLINAMGLLIIEAEMKISPFLPSKYADYVMVNKNILSITPTESSIRDYCKEYGAGYVSDYSYKSIYESIKKVLKFDVEKDNDDDIKFLFASERIACEYLRLFDYVINKSAHS